MDVVLGHICSGATKASLPIYNNPGILVISPSATNPGLTQRGEYPDFFRTIAPDDGVKDTTFIKVAGKNAEGTYVSGSQDTSDNPLFKVAIDEGHASNSSGQNHGHAGWN